MLSRAEIKFVKSLHLKKYREKEQLFLAEGAKVVHEALYSNVRIKEILVLDDSSLYEDYPEVANATQSRTIAQKAMEQVSGLKSAPSAIAIIEKPQNSSLEKDLTDQWALGLEEIQDPSNLGAIIRTADWFGVKHIFCTPGCADVWQPKVIRSSMGSAFRLSYTYEEAEAVINAYPTIPKWGTAMEENDLSKTDIPKAGILFMGNEGRGLSESIARKCDQMIAIPRRGHAESLNVAVSTGIFLYEIGK